jgi:chromosome segregation ATPase
MRRSFSFLIGLLLIATAIAGLALSAVGIAAVWRVEKSMLTDLDRTLSLLDSTLQASADGLVVAGDSLNQSMISLGTLSDTIETTGTSIHDTIPLIETMAKVTTQELPETIASTQAALESAQTSARVVDATLTMITSIPLLRTTPYQANQLGDAMGDISTSLDPIPVSLLSMEDALASTQTNLGTVQQQFSTIAGDIEAIQASLSGAQGVIDQYQGVVAALQEQVTQARSSLESTLITITWAITILLIWLGLTQIGLLTQGLERTASPRREDRAAAAEPAPTAAPNG